MKNNIAAQISPESKSITLTASTEQEYDVLFAAVMDLPEILEKYIEENSTAPKVFIETKDKNSARKLVSIEKYLEWLGKSQPKGAKK